MSTGKKKENPHWTREETILAYEVYLKHGALGAGSKEVKALSEALNALPIHSSENRKTKFRTDSSVAAKLRNLAFVKTGKGLSSHSKMDVEVVNEFGDDLARVEDFAASIWVTAHEVAGQEGPLLDMDDEQDSSSVKEGRLIERTHKIRERRTQRLEKLKQMRKRYEKLFCVACGVTEEEFPEGLQECVFEVHHSLPLSKIKESEANVSLDDLVVLCANCHRMIHQMMREVGDNVSSHELVLKLEGME
jgi:5-methylcytosine-specific restriction protein A